MKADFTRNTFKPGNRYSRVLMQQGRVQLDADWNEQAAIQLGTTRQLAADLMGPHGGPPAGITLTSKPAPAYSVLPILPNAAQTGGVVDFLFLAGHYYVDGILCSNEATPAIVTAYPTAQSITVFTWTMDGIPFAVGQYIWLFCSDTSQTQLVPTLLQITAVDYTNRNLTVVAATTNIPTGKLTDFSAAVGDGAPQRHFVRRAPTYLTQPDFPGVTLPQGSGAYQVYLDVWERAVTCVEDDSIREVALNGPDTAARARVVAQVKLMPLITAEGTCPTPYDLAALLQPSNGGCLMARAQPSRGDADPCTVSPDAHYYGPENQLYRVEVHSGSLDAKSGNPATPTFKWSRENGAVVFPIASGGGTSMITLDSLGRDDRFGLVEGDWVEVLDDSYILQNRAAPLRQVQAIDRVRMTVTLSGQADNTVGGDATKHPYIRRWDQKAGDPAQGGLTLSTTDNAALIFPSSASSRPVANKLVGVNAAQAGFANQVAIVQQNSPWLDLEDGVQVRFTLPPDSTTPAPQFRTGDYWLIPARVATGDVEWPIEAVPNAAAGEPAMAPVAMPPDGVTHHYAPLAQISVGANSIEVDHDCAVVFWPGNTLNFQQNGAGYTVDLPEEIETASMQAHAAAKPAVKEQAAKTTKGATKK